MLLTRSVNYKTGSDLNDFMHGYLNYQIEHHIWPDLTMLSYKKAQPLVKKVRAKLSSRQFVIFLIII
jgi:fatty acid desaturase